MIKSLTVDVAALQQLPETEPLEPSFIDGGLCGVLSVQVSCVGNTCIKGTKQNSTPEE